MTIDRRAVLGGCLIAGLAVPEKLATLEPTKPTLLFEQTYLKAAPHQRSNLAEFVMLNWFAMDQRALDQGYFTSFQLLEDIDENPDWDLVMVVGYPQAEGYEEPATKAAFDAIRSDHREILVDGKSLKDLGAIVRHHRLKCVAPVK
jgi:hypothetical protein